MQADQEKKFLLIDGSSLLFRAFFAVRGLTTKDGVFTNGVYGFLRMFSNAVDMVDPDYIMVAFDRKGSTSQRTEEYEDYKANREKTPDELDMQFGMTKEVLDALNVKNLDMEGYEADDIIGTMAAKVEDKGVKSYLLTGDRDYFQLVDDQVTVLFTKKGISQLEEVDLAHIHDQYGIEPYQFKDIKGVQGDTSDNIPGVPGIGEKRALRLIKKYGDLDGIYDHIDEISGKKMKENLIENKDIAYMSKRLGTIFQDAPVGDGDLEDYARQAPDEDKLRAIFERLEFHSLAPLFGLSPQETKVTEFEIDFLEEDQWQAYLDELEGEKEVAMAVFGEVPNYIHGKPFYLGLKAKGQRAKLVPLEDHEEAFKKIFTPFFANQDRVFIGFDMKLSIVQLHKLGIEWTAPYKDLMLMDYLLDSNRSAYDLGDLADRELNLGLRPLVEVLGKGKKAKTFKEIDEESLLNYAGGYLTSLELALPILEDQVREKGLYDLFDQVENPMALVLAHMEIIGVAVDREGLDKLGEEFNDLLAGYEAEVFKYAGHEFNVSSPKQLSKVLFEELKLPPGKKTKTGYSTSAKVLEGLVDDHPIAQAVLDYRELAKLSSTYVDGFRPYIDDDGRIRSLFKQTGTATGRLSSTEPNLQNIPVRTEEGRKLRKIFVAEEGNVLVDSDYSQVELRVLASLSKDPVMVQAFQDGEDIHKRTAAEVNHERVEDVTPLERSRAKAVNFGIIYGISDYGLSKQLGISRKAAQAYIDSYKKTYPEVGNFMDQLVQTAKDQGYVTTYYGRRREVPELTSSNFNVRKFGERVALNTPIQGTAADIIKIAMIRVDQGLREAGFKARLVLQIHDELIIECPEEEAEEVSQFVKKTMEEVGDFPVDLLADTAVGKSWYDVK